MTRRHEFSVDEWYHCFNRGVDKRIVFENEQDASRFLIILYLANGTEPMQIFNTDKPTFAKALEEYRGKPIVSLGAYCLMPNHFHLLLKEIIEGGISEFMRKLGIAYTMYFNAKNQRVGNLFIRPFRSRHVRDDSYFQRVLQYIHCNPAELYEPGWKLGKVKDVRLLEKKLIEYPYSSLQSYAKAGASNPILSGEGLEIADQLPLSQMLDEAQAYYSDVAGSLLR
ncbi:MAG: transposase [bacterium]|nr:transposase [bacterium]